MKFSFKKKSGFSLVEVILYTLLVIIISTTMILSLTEVMKSRLQIEKVREVSENSRYANAFIVKNFRKAHALAVGTGQTTNPAAIRLYMDESNSIYFDLDTNVKAVLIDGQPHIIRYLQYNENSGTPVQVTSNDVTVEYFTVDILTVATEPENFHVQLQLTHASGTGASVTTQTSISLRQ